MISSICFFTSAIISESSVCSNLLYLFVMWTCPAWAGSLRLHFASLSYHFPFSVLFCFIFCTDAYRFLILGSSITGIEGFLGGACSSKCLLDVCGSWSLCLPLEPTFQYIKTEELSIWLQAHFFGNGLWPWVMTLTIKVLTLLSQAMPSKGNGGREECKFRIFSPAVPYFCHQSLCPRIMEEERTTNLHSSH